MVYTLCMYVLTIEHSSKIICQKSMKLLITIVVVEKETKTLKA